MKTFILVLAVSALLSPAWSQTITEANCASSVKGKCKACYHPDGTTGATSTNCRRCSNGLALTFTTATPPVGTCTLCADGTGRGGDSEDKTTDQLCTVQAAGSCNVVGSASTTCVNCKAGSYFVAGNTCTACPDGKSKGKDTDLVIPTAAGDVDKVCSFSCPQGQTTCSEQAQTSANNANTNTNTNTNTNNNTSGNTTNTSKNSAMLQFLTIAALAGYALI